jgi:hypothetical protein
MHVHVITRINLKYDENFVFDDERLGLLLNNVLPSIKKQSYLDFKWIALVAPDTDLTLLRILTLIFDEIYVSSGQYLKAYV